MASIQKLSPELIGKIAAGEVVERPASVVKELVENSIDAGATNVTVELRGGGVEYIRISDNGKGIPAEQIRLAFERHATSKLQTAEQLFDVHTLGFRGEALASVAAVAKVSCTSRTQDAVFGVRCTVEGGEFTDIRQAASPVGTAFIIEDLFYNTPVRRKFLKKPAIEAALVSDYMLRLILSHPEIAFRFVSQGKTVYHSMGDGKLESALFCLYGKENLSRMIAVKGHMNGVSVRGYVGVGESARGNRQQQSLFVNGRFFRSAALSRALENGCEGRVMVGKFPMCALFLELPYQNVDVNVHPNKLEVRFQDEQAVAEAVRTLTGEAMHGERLGDRLSSQPKSEAPMLESAAGSAPGSGFAVVTINPLEGMGQSGASFVPSVSAKDNAEAAPQEAVEPPPIIPAAATVGLKPVILPPRDNSLSVMRASTGAVQALRGVANVGLPPVVYGGFDPPTSQPVKTQAAAPVTSTMAKSAPESTPSPQSISSPETQAEQTILFPAEAMATAPRFVGIVFDTYWIFEAGERVLMVDQHAAHERILYDRLLKRLDGEQISQQLLSPQLVMLSPRDMTLAEELRDVLSSAGFQVEPFDDHSVSIHAIPTLFGNNAEPKALFLEALDEWQAGRGQVTGERMRRQVAQMACKSAIKGGDRLNEREIAGFLKDMLNSDVMPTCPHGRPIVVEMTRYALEKRFKRVQ